MRIKILLVVLLFCGLAGHAQTIHVWERPSPVRDTVHKHWHSWSTGKEFTENVKDSAYKYWKLRNLYEDSARIAAADTVHYTKWVRRYYDRKDDQYNRKSIYYKEKQ